MFGHVLFITYRLNNSCLTRSTTCPDDTWNYTHCPALSLTRPRHHRRHPPLWSQCWSGWWTQLLQAVITAEREEGQSEGWNQDCKEVKTDMNASPSAERPLVLVQTEDSVGTAPPHLEETVETFKGQGSCAQFAKQQLGQTVICPMNQCTYY